MRNTVLGSCAALALVTGARLAGARVVRDRCLAGAQRMTITGEKTVGDELGKSAAGGTWEIGALDANATRPVSYRRGDDVWEWKCLDEATRPSFIAVSNKARELTPGRWFPAAEIPEPRRP